MIKVVYMLPVFLVNSFIFQKLQGLIIFLFPYFLIFYLRSP